MMGEQKKMIEDDILTWENQFKAQNNRTATEADR